MAQVAVVYNDKIDFVPLLGGSGDELVGEWDDRASVERIASELETAGHGVCISAISDRRSVEALIASTGADTVVFNLCEMAVPFSREALIPALLELLGVTYTFGGPDAMVLTLDKFTAELILREHGLAIPGSVRITAPDHVTGLGARWGALTLKPVADGSGIGVTHLAPTADAISAAQGLLERFPTGLIAQPTLDGPDLTVAVLEIDSVATVLDVLVGKIGRPMSPCADSQLRSQASEAALEAFGVLRCRDAARIDFVVDSATGSPVLVDVNQIPLLDPARSYFIDAARNAGLTPSEAIAAIVDSALRRRNRTER